MPRDCSGAVCDDRPTGEFTVPGLAPGWTYRSHCCPGTMINGDILPFVDITTFTAEATPRITQLGNVDTAAHRDHG